MAVIKDLADGLSTLPAWAIPVAKKITTPHLYLKVDHKKEFTH